MPERPQPAAETRPDCAQHASGRVSEQLERWLAGDSEKTLAGLIATFGTKSFALVFVLLLGVPALPLPTGGATHVFELIAILLALELAAGVDKIWLPRRWGALELAGERQKRFIAGLTRLIKRLERFSRPRGRALLHHRVSNIVFALLVVAGALAAFLAPPFTGLDTLPSLGVVLLSLGVLLDDLAIVIAGVLVGVAGVALEIVLASLVVGGVESLL